MKISSILKHTHLNSSKKASGVHRVVLQSSEKIKLTKLTISLVENIQLGKFSLKVEGFDGDSKVIERYTSDAPLNYIQNLGTEVYEILKDYDFNSREMTRLINRISNGEQQATFEDYGSGDSFSGHRGTR